MIQGENQGESIHAGHYHIQVTPHDHFSAMSVRDCVRHKVKQKWRWRGGDRETAQVSSLHTNPTTPLHPTYNKTAVAFHEQRHMGKRHPNTNTRHKLLKGFHNQKKNISGLEGKYATQNKPTLDGEEGRKKRKAL